MKTTFKILMLIILFSILFISTVNAASILMNLEDYTQNVQNAVHDENNLVDTNTTENQLDNNILDNQTNSVNESEDEDDNLRVTYSTTSSDDDNFLTTENILSIIIIVIGVLLVFFAVAILIRIK
mgnify:CR=1 FL=1